MKMKVLALIALITAGWIQPSYLLGSEMSFFVTSGGPGKGGDLNGLAGADAHCKKLAAVVGAGDRDWKAYLSSVASNIQMQIYARDRIGAGPWFNAKGDLIAKNVEQLHSDKNNLSKHNSLTESGDEISGFGDKPNRHDILTGSLSDGTAAEDTCVSWTSSSDGDQARVGHHDRKGGNNRISWNSAHESLGCSQEKVKITGGDGLFYCFAAD